jgi:hypothetical protein
MTLFKKITETVTQDGLKWAENCNLADVAFGIKKIQTTFTMGAKKYVIYRPLFCFICKGGQFSRSVFLNFFSMTAKLMLFTCF